MKIKYTCKQCGKEFEAYASPKRIFCSESCRCSFYNTARKNDPPKRECPICHTLFIPASSKSKFCSRECYGLSRRKPKSDKPVYVPKPPRIKKCEYCGKPFHAKGRALFCPECRPVAYNRKRDPYWKSDQYKKAHRRHALNWQRKNPEKQRAQHLATHYPERLNVLYECPCDTKDKHNHHPDYSKPYEVIRLCGPCHRAEHKRLRELCHKGEVRVV